MRIALLTDGIHPYVIGGIQVHSFYLAKYFAQNKIEVDLYHPDQKIDENTFLNCFTPDEIKYIHPILVEVPKSSYFPGHYIAESYTYSKNIFEKYLKNKTPDFIYAQGFCGWKLIKEKKNGNSSIPAIGINFHGLNMFQPAFGLQNHLNNILFKPSVIYNLKHAECVFSLGGNLTKLIYQYIPDVKSVVEIPIGIDDKWLINESEIQNNKPISFVFIGRNDKVKGIDLLNQAIHNLLDKNNQFEFNFIGPFPDEIKLQHPNIKYHGEIRDTIKLKNTIQKSDVIVSSSFSEGMPTVILEAMACGLAVVATDVGAVAELVDIQNGKLIASGSINELEDAMLEFIKMDDKKLLVLKKHSIEKVRSRFLWEKIITQTIMKIKRLIS